MLTLDEEDYEALGWGAVAERTSDVLFNKVQVRNLRYKTDETFRESEKTRARIYQRNRYHADAEYREAHKIKTKLLGRAKRAASRRTKAKVEKAPEPPKAPKKKKRKSYYKLPLKPDWLIFGKSEIAAAKYHRRKKRDPDFLKTEATRKRIQREAKREQLRADSSKANQTQGRTD